MGRKLITLSVQQKIAVLDHLKKKTKTKTQLVKEYGCSICTINRILKNEDKIRQMSLKNVKIKRQRNGLHTDVENALKKWFIQVRDQNALVSGQILMNKAKELAVKLKIDFEPTKGWLYRWQKRENIKFTKIHGESNDADHEAAENFTQNILPSMIENYEPEDIFNADESGLFYKALPSGTLAYKGETCKGFKTQKKRLTVLFFCNATGTYKRSIVVGSSKSPRCFKNKNIPIAYYANTKAWMTSDLWNKILLEFENEMSSSGRKVILFIDNAPCHKITVELSSVKIEFLPANTTAISQPLDQGIIRSFKSYYRQILLRKQIIAIEKGINVRNFIKSISLLDVMFYIKRSWWLVESQTIKNCFRKVNTYIYFDDFIFHFYQKKIF